MMKISKLIGFLVVVALLFSIHPARASIWADIEEDFHNDINKFIPSLGDKVFRAQRLKDKVVAITVDDGPDPRFTPRMLEAFQKENVKATFFVVGKNVEQYPDLIKREVREGHALGNHTYDHPVMLGENYKKDVEEIEKCRAAIRQVTGQETYLFRPPRGLWNHSVFNAAAHLDYSVVLWSVTVEHEAAKTPQDMADRIIKLVEPGNIILCHDGRLDRSRTVEAMPLIIKGLKAKGYKFVTLSELMKMEGVPVVKRDHPTTEAKK